MTVPPLLKLLVPILKGLVFFLVLWIAIIGSSVLYVSTLGYVNTFEYALRLLDDDGYWWY